MNLMNLLPPRRGAILRIIVGDYIERASPVASEHIAKDHSLGVSPATIRNDMAALEEEGYITHPHTSAGRIPSDKGYRYFIDGLMQEDELSSRDRGYIRAQFRRLEGEPEEWSRLAAELLARLAHAVALTTGPWAPSARFKHLELVLLQEFLVLLVLVLQETKVKQQQLRLEEAAPQDELSKLAHQLSAAYEGLNARQIAPLAAAGSPFAGQVTRAVARLMADEDVQRSEALYLEGLRNLLDQPEFSSPERWRALMELVEERRTLISLFPKLALEQGVRVVIGRENPAEELHDYSLVLASYGTPSGLSGAVGVLGPTRMHYARAISTVRYLSGVMTELVAERYS